MAHIRARRSIRTLIFGLLIVSVRAGGADIWLSGEDPVVHQYKHRDGPSDYMNMFTADAPWSTAASTLKTVKISTQIVLRGTDEQLRTIIDGLKMRHVDMAVEIGLLAGSDRCGKGVEGYTNPAAAETAAKRIKSLGGQIDYVAMDEPVWFGHIFKEGTGGRVGCQYTLADVVEQIASKIAIFQRYFPNIKIGDIEPINAKRGGRQSIDDIVTFETLLHQKTGVAPAFFHADVSWRVAGWQPLLEDLATRLRAKGIRFGVICNGDGDADGDREWIDEALQRCKAVAANPKTKPDDIIVQSWNRLPSRMLPETDPGALTYGAKQAAVLFH